MLALDSTNFSNHLDSRRAKFHAVISRFNPPLLLTKRLATAICAVWLATAAADCFAQQQPAPPAPDPFAMDINSLFNTTVTTASKFPEKLSDAAGVVSVVTQDELTRFGGTTLLEVLERVAGLNVSTTFLGDSSLITIRGDQTRANAGHILILINGRPVREILEGGVSSDILESFPIDTLERIEVVKGPGSVLYGSDAFSGVINLITKKAKGNEVLATAAGGAAGESALTERILFEKGALNIVEGGQYHDWPRWNITETAIDAAAAVSRQNAILRDDGIGGYLGINYKGLGFMTSYTGQEAPSYVRGIVGDTRLKRGFANLGYALQASAKWKMTFDSTYSRSVMNAPDYPTIHRDSYEADLEWTNFITLSSRDKLTFGTVYNHIEGLETYFGVTPSLIDAKGSRNAGEAYIQYERKLTDTWKLIGGVQANKIGAIAVNAVPRGGVLWNPSDHFTAKVLYGGAYNAPSLDETLLNHPGLKGNPNLTPEKVGTLDAQLAYQSNRVQASVDYFNSRQNDLIIQNGAVFPAVYYNDPIPVHFQGGEAEAKYYLKHEWFLTGSALYQVNDSGSGAKNLSPSPAMVAKAGLSYKSSKGDVASLFDAWQSHISGYESTLNPPADAFHSVSAHVRYDLSRRWLKSENHGVALFLNADDLLNKPVWLPALGSGAANTIPVTRGRTAMFGVEVWQKQDR
jgi:outer membrane receptor protein involved in Fe transport